MHDGASLKRGKGRRPANRRFLIYCEGECTEVHYFKGLKSELRSLPVELCVGGTHGEPLRLVRTAVEHQRRAPTSSRDRYAPYDEVRCVIDVEAPKPHGGLAEALRVARRNHVNLALSNPCFELWVLLHFRNANRYMTSDQAQRLLARHECCGYSPDRKHLDYQPLPLRHAEACERAQTTRSRGDGSPGHLVNPWTDVDLLVEHLKHTRWQAR